MSYLPEIRDALHSAAARQAGLTAHRRPATRWRAGLARVPIALAVLASVALGGFFLASLHSADHGSSTPGGNPGGATRVPAAWARANFQAIMQSLEKNGRCNGSAGNATKWPPRTLTTAPGKRFTSLLAVLRHPAPAGLRVSARNLDRLQPHVDAQGIYIRYARHGVADGITYYMIPAQEVGEIDRPARCYALQLTAFKHQIASLPSAEQARAVTYEKSAIRQEHGPRPGIVLRTSGDGSTGSSYIPLDHLHARAFGNGGGGNDQITKTALLLPNLVASVTARYPRQTYPGVVKHAVTVTKAVIDNLVIFVFRGAWDPPKLTFRSSTGAVLWRSP